MIPGVIASALSRIATPGTPEWVPEGAVAYLDFVNGQYYAAGAVRAINTLLGGGFDPDEITGSGYHVGFDVPANNPNAAGALLSDLQAQLLAGATLVFEVQTAAPWNGTMMFVMDAATVGAASEFLDFTITSSMGLSDGWDLGISGGGGDLLSSGLQKIGATINRDIGGGDFESAVSANGGTAVTDTVDYNFFIAHLPDIDTINLFHLSGLHQIEGDVKTVTLYPAVDGTALAALTA